MDQASVAEAVHRAVCRFTQGDGCGHCKFYAVAGAALLTRLTKRLFLPQTGALRLLVEEPEGWFVSDPGCCGDPMTALSVGAFHCWIAEVTEEEPGFHNGTTIIDFSSRQYQSLVKRCVGDSLAWNRPEPPTFVWIEDGVLPDWLSLTPVGDITTEVVRRYVEFSEFYGPLVRQADIEYDRLAGQAGDRARTKERRKARKAERQRRKKARICR
jgi:hypothetical protein